MKQSEDAYGNTLATVVRSLVREEVVRVLADHQKPEEFLSTTAAARLASVHPGTIRRWIRERKLEPRRAGRVVRVRRNDLEQLLRDGGRAAGSPEELADRMYR